MGQSKNYRGIALVLLCLALYIPLTGCSDPFGFQAEKERIAEEAARMKAERIAEEAARQAQAEADRLEREQRRREWEEAKAKKDAEDRVAALETIPVAKIPDMSRLSRMTDVWDIPSYATCLAERGMYTYGLEFCWSIVFPEAKANATEALQRADGLKAAGERYEAALLYAEHGKQDKARELATAMGAKSGDWVAVSHIAALLGDEAMLFEAVDYGVRELDQVTRGHDKVLEWLENRGLPELATKVAERYGWSTGSIRIYRTRALQFTIGNRTPSWSASYAGAIESEINELGEYGAGSRYLNTLVSDITLLARIDPARGYAMAQAYLAKDVAVVITNEKCGEGCDYTNSRGTVELIVFLVNYEKGHKVEGEKASDLYMARAAKNLAALSNNNAWINDYFAARDELLVSDWNHKTKVTEYVPMLRSEPTVWDLLAAVRRTKNTAAIRVWNSALEGLTADGPACREFGRYVLGTGFNPDATDLDEGSAYVFGRIKGQSGTELPDLTTIPLGEMPHDEQPSCRELDSLRGIGAFLAPYDGTVQEMLAREANKKD